MIREILLTAALLSPTGLGSPAVKPFSAKSAPPVVEPKPKDLSWFQQQDVFLYGSTAVTEQCSIQPSNLWCIKQKLSEKTLSAYEIIDRSLNVKNQFQYVADTKDNWRVHSSAVLMGQDWRGDCDDLTSTTLDILIRAGQPRNRAWMVLADVNHTGILDHLIGMVQDNEGHFWIVGDTSAQNAYPTSRVKYRIVGVARADNMTAWLDPHTVGAFPADAMQSTPITPLIDITDLLKR